MTFWSNLSWDRPEVKITCKSHDPQDLTGLTPGEPLECSPVRASVLVSAVCMRITESLTVGTVKFPTHGCWPGALFPGPIFGGGLTADQAQLARGSMILVL